MPALRAQYGDADARVRKAAAALVEPYVSTGRSEAAAPYRDLAISPNPAS